MVLHGWIKTLRNHLLLVALAAFIAACGSSSDDGANNGGRTSPTLDEVLANEGAEVRIVALKSWIEPVNTPASLTASLPDSSPAGIEVNFTWNLLYQPEGSDITPIQTDAVDFKSSKYEFTPTVAGSYVVEVFAAEPGKPAIRDVALFEALDPSITEPGWFPFHKNHKFRCSTCHGQFDYIYSNGTPVYGKPANHIESTNSCQSCHTLLGFDKIRSYNKPNEARIVDHKEVVGACSGCHDNVTAMGKSTLHVETQLECDECHTTKAFFTLDANGKFDHTNITENCEQCHDGLRATGKTTPLPQGTHPITTSDCHYCHVTTSFASDRKTDHAGDFVLSQRCDNCHGNTQSPYYPAAIGQPGNHPALGILTATGKAMDCGECHGVITFVQNGTFNHRGVLDNISVQSCISCHDGTHTGANALGQDNTNFDHTASVTTNCQNCHNAELPEFKPAFVDHTSDAVTQKSRCDASGCHDGASAPGPDPVTHVDINALGNPNCNACHEAGGSFANGTFNHDTYVSIDANNVASPKCNSCHNDVISIGQSVNHIPTPNGFDCIDCHTTTTFTGATVDHGNLPPNQRCDACHSPGNGGTSQPRNHIPTDGDCGSCHAYPAFDNTTLNFTHLQVDYDKGCSTCHSGDYLAINAQSKRSITVSTVHIPTVDDCKVCHGTSFGAFAGGNYQHPDLNLDNNGNVRNPYGCEGCHLARFSTNHGTILSKEVANPTHIPTNQDCYLCHTDPGGSWFPAQFDHVGITGDCVSCHDGNHTQNGKILGKDANGPHPVVVNVDCSYCHVYPSKANPGFTWLSTGNVDHANLDPVYPDPNNKTCESCHNQAWGDSHMVNGIVVIQYKGPNHQVTTLDCIACHAAGGSFIPATFDHANIDRNTRCDSCHYNVNNPDYANSTGTPEPQQNHVPIGTRDCRECHNTTAFAGAKFDHSSIKASDVCADCHNGLSATGKPGYHVPTTDDCRVCHQTTGWVPGVFDHTPAQIGNKRCDSCHGVWVVSDTGGQVQIATGKPDGHVVTTQDCGVCHKVGAWIPAFFDHAFVTSSTVCGDCHNGSDATGKPGNHIATIRDCRDCHNTSTFLGATFDHLGVNGQCESCHGNNNVAAPKQSNGHIDTSVYVANRTPITCDGCHSVTSWTPPANKFDHVKYGFYYSGNHRGNPGCSFCHRNNNVTRPYVWPTPGTNNSLIKSCAGCHKNDFRANGNHNGGRSGTVEQNKDCSGGGRGCHSVGAGGFG